jgi:hypothetical protein
MCYDPTYLLVSFGTNSTVSEYVSRVAKQRAKIVDDLFMDVDRSVQLERVRDWLFMDAKLSSANLRSTNSLSTRYPLEKIDPDFT